MKSLALSILLVSFAAWASGQTVSIQGSGDMAILGVGANGALINVFVVNGTDANGNPSTLLEFHVVTSNPDGSATDRAGVGLIPNGAFQAQGPSKMSLAVDSSQIAGFTNTTCTITAPPNSTLTCSPSQGGPIQVTWTSNGLLRIADSTHIDTMTGPFTQHMDDHGISSSANTQGSVLGFAFSDTGSGFNSSIGSNHTHTITISKS